MSTPQPFHIDSPQADLDDLASRLARTRWPDELPGAGWDYGVARDRVRELAAYSDAVKRGDEDDLDGSGLLHPNSVFLKVWRLSWMNGRVWRTVHQISVHMSMSASLYQP